MNCNHANAYDYWKKGYNWYFLDQFPTWEYNSWILACQKENMSKIGTIFWDKNSGSHFLVYIENGAVFRLRNKFVIFLDIFVDVIAVICVLFILFYPIFRNLKIIFLF